MANLTVARDAHFASKEMYDINEIRKEFPILQRQIYGKPLIYLDNAATTQKPLCVIDAITEAYTNVNANVHRGVHFLSQKATEQYEEARETVRRFINARHSHEVIFTRGTTESINLVASSFGETFLAEGDEVIISTMEHHSNIVPWQLLAERKGIKLRVIPLTADARLDKEAYEALFNERTRFVSITHTSNVMGVTNPVEEFISIAHNHNVPVLVDGAQSVPHKQVDVQALDADFLVFSGHKIYGPTGIGVLYGKEEFLNRMEPYQGGGEMIQTVRFEKTTFNELPYKFEAGTPDYVGAIALARALDFVTSVGIEQIAAHEQQLTRYALECLERIPDMRIFGKPDGSAVSFLIGDIHPADLGTLLDRLGIAIRTGHHCAQPLIDHFGIPGTVRASFAMYNTMEEVDTFIAGINRVVKMFG